MIDFVGIFLAFIIQLKFIWNIRFAIPFHRLLNTTLFDRKWFAKLLIFLCNSVSWWGLFDIDFRFKRAWFYARFSFVIFNFFQLYLQLVLKLVFFCTHISALVWKITIFYILLFLFYFNTTCIYYVSSLVLLPEQMQHDFNLNLLSLFLSELWAFMFCVCGKKHKMARVVVVSTVAAGLTWYYLIISWIHITTKYIK